MLPLDDLERIATNFRLFCAALLVFGLFLIFINYYNIQWKDLRVESRPREKHNGLQITILLGIIISIFGFMGLLSSSYYLLGVEISGFAKYDDGKPLEGVEIDIPGVEPGYTDEYGYFILHNVARNRSSFFVKTKNKIIHREPTKFSQYMPGLSFKQNITIGLMPLWIHGNLKNEYGEPLPGKIVHLQSNEANMNTTTIIPQGDFDFGKVLVHHTPIGLQPMILSARSTEEILPSVTIPIDIPLEEPYEINKFMIWNEGNKLVVDGVVKSSDGIQNFEDTVVEMSKKHSFVNRTGYYELEKVPITTKEWLVTTYNGTILANGTIYPELTLDENPAYRPLYI